MLNENKDIQSTEFLFYTHWILYKRNKLQKVDVTYQRVNALPGQSWLTYILCNQVNKFTTRAILLFIL